MSSPQETQLSSPGPNHHLDNVLETASRFGRTAASLGIRRAIPITEAVARHTPYEPEAGYDEAVMAGYTLARAELVKKIGNRTLSIKHMIPPVETFGDGLVELADSYHALADANLKPAVVFVPGLERNEWDQALRGLDLSYKLTRRFRGLRFNGQAIRESSDMTVLGVPLSQGFMHDWHYRDVYRHLDPVTCEEYPADNPTRVWQVGVISTLNTPAFTDISADGQQGQDADRVRKLLGDSVAPKSREDSHFPASPTQALYLALQWQRLIAGKLPVDIGTATYFKEKIKLNRAIQLSSDPHLRGSMSLEEVESYLNDPTVSEACVGLWFYPYGKLLSKVASANRVMRNVGVRPAMLASSPIVYEEHD